ncbi:hypothetical protein [Amnibacterium kyonggiense]|uniref:Uncharacterized protein n=1 Tax=Amnibacterium kyonggiense TaxID=595671 RepID=A0A4R7FP63_9MICO|nr:hypothetical protein [Amnibacterium kyonggiense]TDS79525.1 hypothetical protein CLV52_0054 [Amnibacterium kyonggiense]
MSQITIEVSGDVKRRLVARARQAGVTVPALVSDLVAANAVLLSDPEWTTPPRSLVVKIAELVDQEVSAEIIAIQLGIADDIVEAGIRERARLERLAERYAR